MERVGTGTGETGDKNGFELFEDCVTANLAVAPLTYEHTGGPLGIFLADTNYPDNVPGEGERNPEWRLVRDGACAP